MVYKHSHSLHCPLTFLTVPLKHKFSILMKTISPILSFVAWAFGIISKKPLPNPTSQIFSCFLLQVL